MTGLPMNTNDLFLQFDNLAKIGTKYVKWSVLVLGSSVEDMGTNFSLKLGTIPA